MFDIIHRIHRIGIKAPAAQVYEALTTLEGLGRWWTDEVRGDGRSGGEIEFYFRSETGELKGKIVMEAQVLNAPKEVRWGCVEGSCEWVGTDISFQLSERWGVSARCLGRLPARTRTSLFGLRTKKVPISRP